MATAIQNFKHPQKEQKLYYFTKICIQRVCVWKYKKKKKLFCIHVFNLTLHTGDEGGFADVRSHMILFIYAHINSHCFSVSAFIRSPNYPRYVHHVVTPFIVENEFCEKERWIPQTVFAMQKMDLKVASSFYDRCLSLISSKRLKNVIAIEPLIH